MSHTQTILKQPVQASRTFDYLYDPIYTVSSERDHARATFRASTNVARIKRVPDYQAMFSGLMHFPDSTVRIDSRDPVPQFIPRQWRGYQDQARESLARYKKFNYDPTVVIPNAAYEKAEVRGRERFKFFRRPIIPFLQQVPAEVVLQANRTDPMTGTEIIPERAPTPLTRTVMVQTDYRDSETQTDPYSPEYVIQPGTQPELLTLATLAYGHGLPAGLAEVEMIERARAKRAWEATLPALNDVDNLEKRRAMMDEQERREWAFREKEIEELQEARLEVLIKILQQREDTHTDLNNKRLDHIWTEKQTEKDAKFEKIKLDHIKTIRKLTRKRDAVEGKLERRNFLSDYSDPSSQVYAPMSRIGVFLDRGSEQFVVNSRYLSTYQGLLELEASLPDYVLKPRVQAPRPKSSGKGGFVKRKERRRFELDEVAKQLEDEKKPKEPPKPLQFLHKIEKPIPRPPTPSVEEPNEIDEEEELAVIFLQKIIRGRAIQNMIYEGKEKRRELIEELRSTHALQYAEQQIKKAEKQEILKLQRERVLQQHKESLVKEAISYLQGYSLGDMLDFLSKELIRIQGERRIHAFAMLAERQRRMREAEESGRRQLEERRRREEDEIFKQTVKVHQETVETYLEDIIMESVEQTADAQARREIQEMADRVNEAAYEIEATRTELESEEIVAELLTSFLLPEAQKITARENIKRNQRRNLLAAHRVIYKQTEPMIKEESEESSDGKDQ